MVFIDPNKSDHLLVTHSFWRWWWRTPTTWHSLILWHSFFYWIPREIHYFFLFCRFLCDGEVAHPRRSRKITQLPKKTKHENTIHLHDYGFQMFRVFVCCCWNSGWDGLFSSVWKFCLVSLRRKYNIYNIYIYYMRCASFRLCWTRDPMVCNLQAFIISSVFAGLPNLVWQLYLGVMFTPIPGETIQFEEYFSNGLNPHLIIYIYIYFFVGGVQTYQGTALILVCVFCVGCMASRVWLAWSLPGYQHHSCAHSWLPSGVVGRMKRVEFDGVCVVRYQVYIIDLSISLLKICLTGLWFQICFYFHPYLGKISMLTHIFSNGLKPPPS